MRWLVAGIRLVVFVAAALALVVALTVVELAGGVYEEEE